MESSTYPLAEPTSPVDGVFRFDGPGTLAPVLVQIRATTNARDVRDMLLSLAYKLEEPQQAGDMALCLLVKSRLTSERLAEELRQFRGILAPHLRESIFLAAMNDDGGIRGHLPSADIRYEYELLPFLHDAVRETLSNGAKKVSRQAVKSALVNRWLRGDGRQTMADLKRDTAASRPTIQAALSDMMAMSILDHLPAPHGVSMHQIPWPSWRVLATEHAAHRKSYRFVDRSGLSRSPIELSRRLIKLQENRAGKIAVGGLLGACHYYPDLDLSAPTRLDLSIYDADISFVRDLDSGLVLSDDQGAKPLLVVHHTIDSETFAAMAAQGPIASPMDCMADLIEAGLDAQAEEFSWRLNKMAEENDVGRPKL